jgi:hypothetical protein
MLEPLNFFLAKLFLRKSLGAIPCIFSEKSFFLVLLWRAGTHGKGTGRERSQAHERRAGSFVRLLHSRELSSSSHATKARAPLHLLLVWSVAVVKSLMLPRVVDISCRISGKFSAFFCVHFWLIIRRSFVVFCFSVHRMRSPSSLWFYAMLALRLVVLFWHIWFRLSFHFFSGSARFFSLWIGLFWLFSAPRYITCGAHRCDSMRWLSCSGVFGFGCLSFPFRLYKLFWPVIRLIFWLFSASQYMGCCAPHRCSSIRCFLLCDGCLVLACSILFVFSLPFRLYKVFFSGVFMRVFMSL